MTRGMQNGRQCQTTIINTSNASLTRCVAGSQNWSVRHEQSLSVDLRKCLEAAHGLAHIGIRFVPIPVATEERVPGPVCRAFTKALSRWRLKLKRAKAVQHERRNHRPSQRIGRASARSRYTRSIASTITQYRLLIVWIAGKEYQNGAGGGGGNVSAAPSCQEEAEERGKHRR
ncbi:Protein of uncharacterised function (DUF1382) [Raoultella planticola]|uniref:Protein of uncharacterized function (DUF1382) n=1 Tax=Raoultella planticola TaxID=575 RepID=A0A485ABS6_RAOPL|nr:Protein of uncharacterised function (DUF1382) [Raoultella planticola]